MSQLIYIIEDDESIRELLKFSLISFSYRAETFKTAEEGLAAIRRSLPDMAIFDLMLPGMDGVTAIRLLREAPETHQLPIMILTAKDTETDKVIGLDSGADDYLTKPFGILELGARIRNLFRRTVPTASRTLTAGSITLDRSTHEARLDGILLELTRKEFDLHALLMEVSPNVARRDELLNKVWGYDYIGETRTLDMHIRTLRQKLGDDAECPHYIQTVRGVGYRLTPDGP